ncbi:hypothetical protein E2562_016622 [Oryza meyeriana var. granulata]|uniref:Uncharacterized protein n=1 Tax=Oryza meyeriana var. granulata TaxID=110450 RepID=A0A6G1EJY1_9ORYZ|nr:hypothetical protein E2562_016622 [Oryza meyeriana var. granulata]
MTSTFRVFEMLEPPPETPINNNEAPLRLERAGLTGWPDAAPNPTRWPTTPGWCPATTSTSWTMGESTNDFMMFLDATTWQCPCRDSGKWLPAAEAEAVPRMDNFLPEQGPSSYSPPAWLLP